MAVKGTTYVSCKASSLLLHLDDEEVSQEGKSKIDSLSLYIHCLFCPSTNPPNLQERELPSTLTIPIQSATRTQDNRTVAGGAWYKFTRAGGMGFLQGLWLLEALSASYSKGGEPRRREGAADENS